MRIDALNEQRVEIQNKMQITNREIKHYEAYDDSLNQAINGINAEIESLNDKVNNFRSASHYFNRRKEELTEIESDINA